MKGLVAKRFVGWSVILLVACGLVPSSHTVEASSLLSERLAQVKIVVTPNNANKECLAKLKKRLEELETKLGLKLQGKTINLQIDPGGTLDKNTLAQTDPAPNDPNSVTMTISKKLCEYTGKTLDMLLAHELAHVQRLTGTDGKEYRDKDTAFIAADTPYSKAVADHDIANIPKLQWKYWQAAKDRLEQLKKEEEDAFDLVKSNKAKLDLSDDDLKQNEEWRKSEQNDLDARIKDLEKKLHAKTARC